MHPENITIWPFSASSAEGEVTEGPLEVTVNAVDLVGNVAEPDPDNPVLEIAR